MIRETVTERQFQRLLERILAKVRSGVALREDIDAIADSPEARLPHRWFTIWMERATSAQLEARQLLRVGQEAQAARLYLRASEYFRAAAAIYWPVHGDAAIADAMRLHGECFRAGLDIAGPTYRSFVVQAGAATIVGYLFDPRYPVDAVRLTVRCGPVDGTPEEQYALEGVPAREHGWWVALTAPAILPTPRCAGELLAGIRALVEEVSAGPVVRTAVAGFGDDREQSAEIADRNRVVEARFNAGGGRSVGYGHCPNGSPKSPTIGPPNTGMTSVDLENEAGRNG